MCGRGVAPFVSAGLPSGLSGIMPGMLASRLRVGLIRQAAPNNSIYNATVHRIRRSSLSRGSRSNHTHGQARESYTKDRQETDRSYSDLDSNTCECRPPRLLYSPQTPIPSRLLDSHSAGANVTGGVPLDFVPPPLTPTPTPVRIVGLRRTCSIAGTNAMGNRARACISYLRPGRLRAWTLQFGYEEGKKAQDVKKA